MSRKNKTKHSNLNNQTADFFEKILRASADGIVILDASNNIITANETFCKFFNKKLREVIETNLYYWLEKLDAEALNKWSYLEKSVYSDGLCRDVEFIYTTEKSRVRHFSVNASILESTLLEESGLIISIWRDISAQKKAEDVLKIREKQHLAISKISQYALSEQPSILFFMKKVVKLVVKTMDVDFCKILKLLPDGNELLLLAGVGWNKGIVGKVKVANDLHSQAGYTLITNESVIVNDLRTELRFKSPKLLTDHKVKSGVSVIIQGKNNPFGVLGVHTKRLHDFTIEDVNFLQAIANIISEVVKRDRLEKELRMFNKSLEKRIHERTEELSRYNQKLLLEIEERKCAEEKLKIYTNLINQSNDAIFVIEPETSHFLYFNDKAISNLGYRYKELQNMGVIDIETSVPDLTYWKQMANELKKKKCSVFEGQFRRNDGTMFPVEVNGKYVTHETKDYIIAIARDITERKKMSDALLQSEKLSAMGVMTSGITHEFNNILAIIKGFSLLLKQKYYDHEEFNEKIDIILKSVNDGVGIVDRMQEFTKREADRTELKLVDIGETVEQVIEFSMPRWKNISQANGITYQIDRKGIRKIPKVLINNTELREVILNIVNNSFDSMPEGGCLSFFTWKNGNKVFLSISDTGEGMSEETMKRIFDPFFTTKMPKGTGLGMSVSYGIIKRYGGEIEVESELGNGTTITIQFPLKNANNAGCIDTKIEKLYKLKVSNLQILIVDDEQDLCSFLSEFFSNEDYNVKSVCSGKEAIDLLNSESFDLVLCDLVMPEVSGIDVIEFVNTLKRKPKVGLITGWTEKITNYNLEDLKIDFNVRKPFNFSELSKQINKAFSLGKTNC